VDNDLRNFVEETPGTLYGDYARSLKPPQATQVSPVVRPSSGGSPLDGLFGLTAFAASIAVGVITLLQLQAREVDPLIAGGVAAAALLVTLVILLCLWRAFKPYIVASGLVVGVLAAIGYGIASLW
jgi:hypothetical protein